MMRSVPEADNVYGAPTVTETTEWLAKGRIADDIECDKVVPLAHVQLFVSGREWLHPLHEKVDAASDDALLL